MQFEINIVKIIIILYKEVICVCVYIYIRKEEIKKIEKISTLLCQVKEK